MKTRILGLAIALASLSTAASAASFTTTSTSGVSGITNLLSSRPAGYEVDGMRTAGPVFGNGATAFVSTLTDGQAPLAAPEGPPNNSQNQFSVFNGDVLTYSLGGSFNLTRVEIYNSWNDNGRDDFSNISIAFSTDGTSFVDLVTGLSNGGPHSGDLVIKTSVFSDGAVIAGNATHVRFTFNGLEAGAIGISELAVQGTSAIPEPSTYAAIFGVLALAAAAFRRRSVRA